MIWKIVEKVILYLFILAILYLTSQTILQGIDLRRTELVKEELRREFANDKRDLEKQIIRLELQLSNSTIATKDRMDALEKNSNKNKHNKNE